MKKNIVSIIILSTLLLIGCNKDENISTLLKDEINFTIGSSPNSKTVYDTKDPWQIFWVSGDQITIFCAQAKGEGNKQKASYDVTPNTVDLTRGTLSKASSEGGIGLRWGDNEPHNLYAVYPSIEASGGNVASTSEGKFTFNFPVTQFCSINGITKDANGNYMLKPDMNNAYMVAKQENINPSSVVELHFKPIATTLEITLQGKSIQDLRTGDNEDLTTIIIRSLEISIPNNDKFVNKSGNNYQVKFDATKDFYAVNALQPYSSVSDNNPKFTVKISDGADSLQLAQDESVTFTVFLPPIENIKDVKATFNVASGSANNSMTILADGVKYGSKRRITMPKATEYPFSTFMEDILTKKFNIKKVNVNGKEIIDITNPATRTAIEKIPKIQLSYSSPIDKSILDKIKTDSEIKDQFKGIECLKGLIGFSLLNTKTNYNFTTIDFSRFPKSVTTLAISSNNFNKVLGLDSLSNLSSFSCNGNKLTQLDLSKNKKLTNLACANNKLSSLDVSENPLLNKLNCYGNQLTELDVTNCKLLTELLCYSNKLSSLDVSENPLLNKLNCYGNQLTELDVTNCKLLTELLCYSNKLNALDITQNTELITLNCNANKISALDITQNTKLTYLYCKKNSIPALDITQNTELITLNCSANKISALDATKNTKLKSLYCSENKIATLDVTNCTALTELNCYGNQLSVLDVTHNTELTTLYCYINQLTTLNLTNNINLKDLRCNSNRLNTLDITHNTNLTIVDCSKNNISALDVTKNTQLTSLICNNNKITILDLTNCTALSGLKCFYNNLSALNITTTNISNSKQITCYNQYTGTITLTITAAQNNSGIDGYGTGAPNDTVNVVVQ